MYQRQGIEFFWLGGKVILYKAFDSGFIAMSG